MNRQNLISPIALLRKAKRMVYLKRGRYIYRHAVDSLLNFPLSVNHENKIFFRQSELSELHSGWPCFDASWINEEIESARELLKRRFTFLEHSYDFNSEEIVWDKDPITGRRWPNNFAFDIAFRGPNRLSDIKLPWELAKMQCLFILGKAYAYTGDERFAFEIIAQIDSWISANLPMRGIHWISALEVGMRVASFVMVYPFIKNLLEPSFLNRYKESIYIQTEFIENNLSESKHANTHLIGEAFTLVLVGLFLNSPKSKSWYNMGFRILSEQISKQLYSDGVDKEQSFNYQRFFLDYYYLFIILHKQNALDYPVIIDETVERMTEFLMYSIVPDGSGPSFGDTDDARGIHIKSNCKDDYKSLLALGAVLFNRTDFKSRSEILPEEVFWLLGKEGVEKYNSIEPIPPAKTSIGFDSGGYYIMRNGWDKKDNYLTFDCGPLGLGEGGHGHADALSFQMYANGQSFFIDPGTYSYNLDYSWRDYFRSTYAHSTLTVDGKNQSEMNDRMSWKSFAQSKCNLWITSGMFDLVDGEHDGYERLKDPVSHRRVIFSNRKDYFLIFDRLSARKEHTYDCNLHLHPDCRINNNGGALTITNNESITVYFISDKGDLPINMYKGSEKPRAGWYSKNYGSKEETTTINVRKKVCGDTSFLVLISTSPDREYLLKQAESNKAMCVSVRDRISESEDFIFYSLPSIQHFEGEEISIDGQLVFLKKNRNKLAYLYAKNICNLTLRNEIGLSSSKLIDTFNYDKNRLRIICSDDIISDLEIIKMKNIKLFINENRYNLINNQPVLI